MKRRSSILALAALSFLRSASAIDVDQKLEGPKRLHYSRTTGGEIMLFPEFEQAVQIAASEANVPPEVANAMLQDFRRDYGRRLVPAHEWKPFLLESLYKQSVPYALARRFLDTVPERFRNSTASVDTGFLEELRTVDLGEAVVRKFGTDGGVTAPRPISQPLPPYSEAAKAARIEGLVLLRAVVLEDGSLANITMIRGLGYGLDESAILTIQNRWRFQPGTRQGKPVPVEANIEVSFRLH